MASAPEPQKRMRESENAAGMLIAMVIATTARETTAELRKNVR